MFYSAAGAVETEVFSAVYRIPNDELGMLNDEAGDPNHSSCSIQYSLFIIQRFRPYRSNLPILTCDGYCAVLTIV